MALVFLLLLTMLGITASNTATLEERMAGNARDRPEHMLTWKGQAYLAIGLINFRAFLAQNLKRNRKYYVLATEDG